MKTDTETLELLERVRSGNDDAFALLERKYRTVTEALVSSFAVTGGEEDREALSEDLRQEARLALYRAALSYDEDGDGQCVTFGLYAKICVKNALISERRKRLRHKRKLEKLRRSAVDRTAGTGISADGAEGAVLSRIELDVLMKRAESVMSPYELRVLRHVVEGHTPREISREVRRTEKSVCNAIYRIKVKLRKLSR